MKKTINHQTIYTTAKYISMTLQQPYWSAFQVYGWDEGVEGIGINEDIILLAEKEKKKILVNYKDAKYEITPKKARSICEMYHSYYLAKGVKLYEIPRTAFKKIVEHKEENVEINPSVMSRLASEFRAKYGKQ